MENIKEQLSIIEALAEKLEFIMNERGISQYKLAKLCGLPSSTVKSIIQKRASGVNFKTIILIAHGLNIPLWEFVHDDRFLAENLNLD